MFIDFEREGDTNIDWLPPFCAQTRDQTLNRVIIGDNAPPKPPSQGSKCLCRRSRITRSLLQPCAGQRPCSCCFCSHGAKLLTGTKGRCCCHQHPQARARPLPANMWAHPAFWTLPSAHPEEWQGGQALSGHPAGVSVLSSGAVGAQAGTTENQDDCSQGPAHSHGSAF